MIAEKTIHICGRDVALRYCAASETGYEQMTGQSSEIFFPEVVKDDDGNVTDIKQRAKVGDYIKLAIASIIAAYARKEEDAPITADEILYDAGPEEIRTLVATVIQLHTDWYTMPEVVKPEFEVEGGEKPKNAQPPTTSTKK